MRTWLCLAALAVLTLVSVPNVINPVDAEWSADYALKSRVYRDVDEDAGNDAADDDEDEEEAEDEDDEEEKDDDDDDDDDKDDNKAEPEPDADDEDAEAESADEPEPDDDKDTDPEPVDTDSGEPEAQSDNTVEPDVSDEEDDVEPDEDEDEDETFEPFDGQDDDEPEVKKRSPYARERRAVRVNRRCIGPMVRGRCKRNIKRYWYDTASNTCKEFSYSGCQPTPNNWIFLRNCQRKCIRSPAPAPKPKPLPKPKPTKKPVLKWNDKRRCVGPVVRGPCKRNINRYNYDSKTDSCKLFKYGGCGATPNNWVIRRNCENICTKKKPAPPAKLKWNDKRRCVGPVIRGPCKRNIRRFHYDAKTDSCRPFSFGGCQATPNNWVFPKNCQKICVKRKPAPKPKIKWNDKRRCVGAPSHGPCKKNILRYNYDAKTDSCKPFRFGGCERKPNNWNFVNNCRRICVKDKSKVKPKPALKWNDPGRCRGPQVRGPCKRNIRRYHYDHKLDRCVPFSFGGCQPTPNNWWFLKNCQRVCEKKETTKPTIPWNDKRRCVGPMVVGKCKAAIRRFYYDQELDRCVPFIFGGCGATPNNWWHLKNCQRVCMAKQPEKPKYKWNDKRRCIGPVVRGPCKKNIKRFHYDASTDSCKPFSFGGCGATPNNWWYEKNCEKICVKNKPNPVDKYKWNDKRRCVGPVVRGPCNKNKRRYHYDAEKDRCVPFSFGGCKATPNNWWYLRNCERICVKSEGNKVCKPKTFAQVLNR